MPRISGLECLAIVKNDSDLQTVPVIVLTTSDLLKDRSPAQTYGVDGYLVKPDGFDKLVIMASELCTTWL